MSGRFGARDLGLVIAGLAGLAVFIRFYRDATPRAAVSLQVSSADAVGRAHDFLTAQGAHPDSLKEAVQFDGNTDALLFLQRTVGLDTASQWARERVPIWSWTMRWFRPEQKEEWQVRVGLHGEIEGFAHLIDEADSGASLSQDSALVLARAFLTQRGWDLSTLDRVEASSTKREHRVDHHFVWERHGSTIAWKAGGPKAGTGSERVTVEVQGDAVGQYRHFLKVPEEFQRSLQATESEGQFLALVALALMFVLVLVALGVAIARQRHGEVQWRAGIVLGVLVAVLGIGAGAINWPTVKFNYPTQIPWGAYLGVLVLGLLFGAVLYGLWALFVFSAGESLARETFPESLGGVLAALKGKVNTAAMARSSIQGYALGFLLLGYLTGFYVFARHFLGAWMPAEGPYDTIFNSSAPYLAPLSIALVAAITEEGTFRLFGISLMKRYGRSTVLALLVPAVIWAFAHSSYLVFPVYVRGIELTIAGVIFGIAFLRLGFLACVVAHFVIDAVLIGMPLLTSGNAGYLVSGVIVMGIALLPVLLGLGGRGRDGGTAVGDAA